MLSHCKENKERGKENSQTLMRNFVGQAQENCLIVRGKITNRRELPVIVIVIAIVPELLLLLQP